MTTIPFAERLRRRLHSYKAHINALGLGPCIYLKVMDNLNIHQLRYIATPFGRVAIRTNTSDLDVVSSSLIYCEFKDIEYANPEVIIDGGANIGTSAIYFATRYPNAMIYAIEPDRENYALLLINTQRFKNIVPIQSALWSTDTTRTLVDLNSGPWGYSLYQTEMASRPTGQDVSCISIQSLMKKLNLQHIDILKLDIEGGEKELFDHCTAWIESIGLIAVELHEAIAPGCTRSFYSATQQFRRFEQHGEKIVAMR